MKIHLIEAYDALYKYDMITISGTMLDSTVRNNDIPIDVFSEEIYRSNHPSNTKMGGVCLCLSVKRRFIFISFKMV